MNIIKKFLAKKEEKEDLEKFLCTLTDPKPCRKISWLGFLNSFRKDINENRILKIDDEYSWKDWIEDQEGVETYAIRLKKLKDGESN